MGGNAEAEIADARLAVRASPGDAAARYALGNALAGARRLDEAEAAYREALRIQPAYAGAEENLGVLFKWRGDLGSAPLSERGTVGYRSGNSADRRAGHLVAFRPAEESGHSAK
jgi:tetratricopeptide (TPR) repeat protein